MRKGDRKWTTNKKEKSIKLPTAYTDVAYNYSSYSYCNTLYSWVRPAGLSDFVMAPINGLNDSIDIAIFVLLIGGFLGII
mgnify:CR=1 FL=1